MTNDSPVDSYIGTFPESTQAVLQQIRRIIKIELPEAEEVISYGIPAFRYKNKTLVYFAGWKEHVSTYPIPSGDPEFQAAIEPYKKGRGTLQFKLDQPLPTELIQQLVRFHIAERLG